MKLALRNEEGIAILDISGPVDIRSFQIVKAGLSKLLKDGRNRIVLHFLDADRLEGEVVREVAILDVFARELSGKIIIAAKNRDLKENIKSFAKPPVMPVLSSVGSALKFFKRIDISEEEEAVGPGLKQALEAKEKEIKALESRLKLLDPKEVTNLRKENALLKERLKLVEGQIDDMVRERRDPVDAEGFLEKVAALEATVKKLSAEVATSSKR